MGGARGQRFKIEAVTDNDARELDLFERYLRHRAHDPKKADAAHYADVYGEVVFDSAHGGRETKDPATPPESGKETR